MVGQTVSVYLRDTDVEMVKAYAQERDWSFSRALRVLVRKALLAEQESRETDPRRRFGWTG